MLRKLLLVVAALLILGGAWVWWNRPQRVDMADYVPADAIVYIEADSLPEIASGIVSTDAWRLLARPSGIDGDFGRIGWLSQLARWTGIGPAQAVVLSRAQIAITVLGFEAEEQASETLKIIPRTALVAETHTGATRARATVEKLVGDFARRTYGSPRMSERKESDDTVFLTWTSPDDARRKMIAAVSGSIVIIGNDESAVEACLAAKRGERPALSSDGQLREMRERMNAEASLAFGYVPGSSTPKLLEVTALAYVGQLSTDPRVQSAIATLLPQLANRMLGGAAWSTRVHDGAVEDNYFLALQSGAGARVGEALVPADAPPTYASEFLPHDIYQISSYNYRDPATAWRGFNAAISSQLDALSAPFVNRFLEEALKPYGIETPREFFSAAGPEMVTARLDNSGASTVLVVAVRDREVLEKQVRKRLGSARVVSVGDVEMLVSRDEERGAASFIGDRLIMGDAANVRLCLEARAAARTFALAESFKQSPRRLFDALPAVSTLTDDRQTARTFISYVARESGARRSGGDGEALERALNQLPFAASESRFISDGFEKRTRSPFGNFGVLVARFAPERQSR
jgi:hypothetical protein